MSGADVVIFTEQGHPQRVEFHDHGSAIGVVYNASNATVYSPPGRMPELTLTVPLAKFRILPMARELEDGAPEPGEPIHEVGNANPTLQLPREEIQAQEKGKGRR